MFCLMDASASMTEPLKDLAKRFFMLLHVFLSRYYREVHIVFIRHTSTAAEVDEETFFRGTETGGTVISTRARGDAEGGARALFARTTGTSTRRRPPTATTSTTTCRAAWSCSTTRSCRCASTSPTSRPRTASASTTGGNAGLARLHGGRPAAPELRHAARGGTGGHLPGVPRPLLGERRHGLRRRALTLTTGTTKLPERKATSGRCSTGRSGTST